jgi:putative endonuclease
MPKTKNLQLGRAGEQAAVDFLKDSGYKIINTNYRTRLGQIDIIARDKKTICFVEVKARRSQDFGQPSEAVDVFKQRKISQVALIFLKEKKLLDSPARFDVVTINYYHQQPKIELIKNAFLLHNNYLS